MKSIYLIGSLRNPAVPELANDMRKLGFDVFDDWYGAGKIADDCWQEYENIRGRHYKDALKGHAAQTIFHFDKTHLDTADVAVLLLPAGKSGHIELGYHLGRGKNGYILFDKTPERYDVMYNFATDVFFAKEDLLTELKNHIVVELF
jgi:nucleoside 2-deoxyribosyltransferase